MACRWKEPHDPVFQTWNRTHLGIRNATRGFDRIRTAAGLPDVTVHAMRHTFASILVSQRNDVVFVSDQLGHRDPSVTLRVYAKLFRAAGQRDRARDELETGFGHMLRRAQ